MNQISDFLNDHIIDVLPEMPQTPTYPSTNMLEDTALQDDLTHISEEKKLDIQAIKSKLYKVKDDIDSILRQLDGNNATISLTTNKTITDSPMTNTQTTSHGDKIIEGVFNGEKMIGSDGHEYAVPPNYASKSKLVEGDIMKLTMTPQGRFIYKQINPIERKMIIGTLVFDTDKQLWYVRVDNKDYKILTASVTFYKGKPGDEAIILVSEAGDSSWGAVDNIISSSSRT